MNERKLSVRAMTVLQREFSCVPKPAELREALRRHRRALELGWSPLQVLLSLKGSGRKTANEIAVYAGIQTR
jgi:hypothetical protein